MNRADALAMIRLLSALESHLMTSKTNVPDYLLEQMSDAMETLEAIVLGGNDDERP